MPNRNRLFDFRVYSTAGEDLGFCQANINKAASYANAAQRRLMMGVEAGEEGWWGTWAEMAFTVSRDQPYLTLPREVARLELIDVCNQPRPVHNQFYEYLQFGNGRFPKLRPFCNWRRADAFTRNVVSTFVDLSAPGFIAVYPTDPADVQAGKRVFIGGVDNNGNTVYTIDKQFQVAGQFLILNTPFVTTPQIFSQITGIQKDQTVGPVQFFQLDPNTGAQTLLLTMEPSETSAAYRRYYFDRLPRDCCFGTAATPQVQVTAIVKLDPVPLQVDTDYFLLQGDAAIEALIDEAQSIRYSKMDSTEAKTLSAGMHKSAIGILNGILNQYIGKNSVAVDFKPFGNARLSKLNVGMI